VTRRCVPPHGRTGGCPHPTRGDASSTPPSSSDGWTVFLDRTLRARVCPREYMRRHKKSKIHTRRMHTRIQAHSIPIHERVLSRSDSRYPTRPPRARGTVPPQNTTVSVMATMITHPRCGVKVRASERTRRKTRAMGDVNIMSLDARARWVTASSRARATSRVGRYPRGGWARRRDHLISRERWRAREGCERESGWGNGGKE